MKKHLLIAWLLTLSLFAKDMSTCNTVQLVSYIKTDNNINLAYSKKYPADCKIMQIGNTITVRCGCFDTVAQAKERLEELKLQYKDASLAATYRFRFGKQQQRVSQKEKELRLMLQVFLYKGDLESAFKVAQIGYKQHPNSYYWNEQMANISMWTNRSQRAMKHLKKMYDIRHDPKIEAQLIKFAKANFQYENIEPIALRKVQQNPNEENINFLITIYKKTGFPEKAIEVLDAQYAKTHNTMLLTKALALALEIGDLSLAQKYVTILEKHTPYTKDEAALIAKYYYIQRQLNKAFTALQNVSDTTTLQNPHDEKEIRYFQLKSDIGWYMQHNLQAAQASKVLIDHNKGRIADYERVALVYQELDPDVAANAVKEAYKKYKLSYMFFSYANTLLAKKRFDELDILFRSVDETNSALTQEPMYWILKAQLYNHFKQYAQEEEALKKALALAPQNLEIHAALLWHFMEIHDTKNLHKVLSILEDKATQSPSLYFTLASAYFYLHNIDRARYYLSKTALFDKNFTHSLQYKFLEASIYQTQGKTDAFRAKTKEIYQLLQKQLRENDALYKNTQFLVNYLNVALYIVSPDTFEKELHKAKPHLDTKTYNEIAYSWALYNRAYEKSHSIFHKQTNKEPWMTFSDALIFEHYTTIENVLDLYLHAIGPSDAVSGALKDKQIARAQSLNFENYDKNSHDLNSYIQHIDLSKQRTDLLDITLSRYFREPLLQYFTKIHNTNYIGDSWKVLSSFEYYDNSSSDTNILIYTPQNSYRATLGLMKQSTRLQVSLTGGYADMLDKYFLWDLESSYQLSSNIKLSAEIAHSKEAQESTQLYLGGKKDLLQGGISYKLLNSTTLNLQGRAEEFYSQDDIYLGHGKYINANVAYQIRQGYPDMAVTLFYDRGLYNETQGSRGVIDQLQNQNFNVLPNDFYNIGMNFSYGLANRNLYTRVWRPYVEFFPYYNSDLDDYTYGFNLGYGGKAWHQDHLSIGISYTDSVNGIGGKIFEIYIDYQFLYTLSKEI